MQSVSPMMFDLQPKAAHPKRVVRTAYTDERELLNDILWLYNGGDGVDLDPCYSIGRFWQGLPQPKFKFDLRPQLAEVGRASSDNLPIENESINSVMFDPPFLVLPDGYKAAMVERFTSYQTLDELQSHYTNSLKEFYRIMVDGGLLLFKCQDLIFNHKAFMTHVFIINQAESIGFFCHDVIILVRDNVLLSGKVRNQEHARKTHSYYVVLSKGRSNPCVQRTATPRASRLVLFPMANCHRRRVAQPAAASADR